MTPIDRTAAEAWLGALPGGSLAEQYVAQWDSFAGTSSPVVTLFGSYDTGKSALLRRFLVDAGETVPDWLTISARHETFEVRETTLHGCCVRDTPGFVVGASDMRGRMNTENAMSAVNLTDIAIATVTPQLATAERDALRAVVSESWLPGSLWFIISRFDEAGVDPDSDVNEYRELRRRKVQELRESFDLHSSTPIFVVAQDSFQLAGQERQPDPAIWDDSREWDGIDEVAGALSAIPGTDLSALRTAAERRYWRHAVASTVDELRRRLVDHERDLATARSGVDRRGAWLEDLQAIDAAARASLRGSVAEAVRIELDFVPGTLADSQGQASELSRVLRAVVSQSRIPTRPTEAGCATVHRSPAYDAVVGVVRCACQGGP